MEKSKIDLNKPITNQSLVDAIKRFNSDKGKDTENYLFVELQKANFLAAIITDEMKTTTPNEQGKMTIKEESLIKVLSASDNKGNTYLPLFTDWDEIAKYTDLPVSSLVLPAADAWYFSLNTGSYHGIVINPSGDALTFDKHQIKLLSESLKKHSN